MTPRPSARRLPGAARLAAAAVALSAALVAPAAARAQQPGATPAGPAARALRPLSLEEAVQRAERQSEAVRIAEAGVLRARGQFTQARSQILPQLNASGVYQKQIQNQFQALQRQEAANAPPPLPGPAVEALCAPRIPFGASDQERLAALALSRSCAQGGDALGGFARAFANPNNIILGVSGSQLLFAGGRITAGLRAAEAGRRSADIAVSAARAQVTLDVAQAYFDAALAQRLVAISESSLVQTERAFRQTAIGREVGQVSEFDLLRARVARDNQRPVLIQARAQRDIALTRLRQLLDLPLDEPLQLTTPLPTPPADPGLSPTRATASAATSAATSPATSGASAGSVVPGAPQAVAAGAGAPTAARGTPRVRRDTLSVFSTPDVPPRVRGEVGTVSAPNGVIQVAARDTVARFASVEFDPAEVLGDDPAVTGVVDSAVAAADTVSRDRATARQTRENVTVQRNLLRVARAQRLPAVQLSTNYQRFAYPPGTGITLPTSLNQFLPNWTVALGVSVPIFTGGRIRGDELIAEANLREAEQTARQVEELSALDARLAISQLAQAEAAWRASAGTAGQATRAYTIAEVRFREGLATQVELADARLLLQQAEANAATAARDREVARLRLALLRDLPLQQQGAGAAALQQRGAAGGAAGGIGAGAGGQQQGQQGQQPRQPQQGAQGAGGFQQTGNPGGFP